MANIKILLKD